MLFLKNSTNSYIVCWATTGEAVNVEAKIGAFAADEKRTKKTSKLQIKFHTLTIKIFINRKTGCQNQVRKKKKRKSTKHPKR